MSVGVKLVAVDPENISLAQCTSNFRENEAVCITRSVHDEKSRKNSVAAQFFFPFVEF